MSDFASMQASAVELLQQDEALSDLEILAEERKDLLSAVNTSLKKLGLCLLVQTLDMEVANPNLPGPLFDKLKLSVFVHENVLIWRTNNDRTALSVAQEVAAALHHKTLQGATSPMLCKGIFYEHAKDALTYIVDFTIGH